MDIKKVDLTVIPICALSLKSRKFLTALDVEQVIPCENGLTRDYRGIADMFEFHSSTMRAIEQSKTPMDDILDNAGDRKLSLLINCLENMGRFDVLDDLRESMLQDAINYEQKVKQLPVRTIGKTESYDAYICYADEDFKFVAYLAHYLESPALSLRLFIRDRDLLLGSMKFEAFTQIIDVCNFVVIILSPEFVKSPECEYQTRYASGLQIEHRERKLIPIIWKACEIPPSMRYVSKIDFSRGDSKWEWVWHKLVISFKPTDKEIPLPSQEEFKDLINESHKTKCDYRMDSFLNTSALIKKGDNYDSSQLSVINNLNEESEKDIKKENGKESDFEKEIDKKNVKQEDASLAMVSNKDAESGLMFKGNKKNWIKSFKQKITNLASSGTSPLYTNLACEDSK